MKKVFSLFFMVLFFTVNTSSCSALDLFTYQSKLPQNINGTVKTNGINDVVTMETNSENRFLQDMFGSASFYDLVAFAGTVAAANRPEPPATPVSDPYIVPIDGVNYVMLKDKKTNDWSERDLLGIDDPKNNMFLSLRSLESDGDVTKLKPEELKKANIRLVKLAENGVLQVNDRLQDYNLDNIKYIDMKNIRRTANNDQTGIFGHFNVYLKTQDNLKKLVVGFVTFDTDQNLKILFP